MYHTSGHPPSIDLHNQLMAAIKDHKELHRICILYSMYVLACCGWNKSRAAVNLDVDRRTVHRWVKEFFGV